MNDLTRTMPGAYTYRRRGLTTELFPDTRFTDKGGTSGWVPFARGTLTSGDDDFVLWNSRTLGGSGVDIVFDLGADCWLDEIAIEHGVGGDLNTGAPTVRLDLRSEGETRLHRAISPAAAGDSSAAWARFTSLDAVVRYLRLHLDAVGKPPYGVKNIGLKSVHLLGLTMAEKQQADRVPLLYPWPAECAWGDGVLELTPETALLADDADSPTAEFLRQRIAERFGLRLERGGRGKKRIHLRRSTAAPPEGYRLSVTHTRVTIEGDALGLFYGALTLLQMLASDARRVTAREALITDAPQSLVRGVHLFMPARENIPFFKRLLGVMADLKMNTVVLEVSGGMRYRSHPEVNAAWQAFAATMQEHLRQGEPALVGDIAQPRLWQNSMHIELAGGSCLEQDEVRDLVAFARRLHITLIPEVQTLSHCYWIACAHPELSERSGTPYPDTYCPSNPAVYPLVFDLMDEVLDVFDPPALCIGHDEAWAVGTCPVCRRIPAARLIAGDVTRLHDHLAQRGVKTWMWADTLDPNFHYWGWVRNDIGWHLHSPDTRGLVNMIPRDIVALNWWWGHFWKPDESTGLLEQVIHGAGLGQLFANFEGAFCSDYAQRSETAGISGGLLPSWVNNAELELGRNGVIHNLIYSANVLWSRRYSDRRQETLREVAARLPAIRAQLGGAPARHRGAVLAPLSLDACANAALADATGALGEYDLRGLPTGDVSLAGTPFRIGDPARHGGRAAVVVQSKAVESVLYPAAVTGIAVGRAVAGLVFLHVVSDSAGAIPDFVWADSPQLIGPPLQPRQTVGRYRIHYADGVVEDVPLRYDEHVTCWNTRFGERTFMPYWSDPAWQGETCGGAPVTVWRFPWHNHRRQPVESVDIIAAEETDCALIVLGITAIEQEDPC